MKNRVSLLLILCIFGIGKINAQNKSALQGIREDLFYSNFDIDKCYAFYKSITDLKDNSPVMSD